MVNNPRTAPLRDTSKGHNGVGKRIHGITRKTPDVGKVAYSYGKVTDTTAPIDEPGWANT